MRAKAKQNVLRGLAALPLSVIAIAALSMAAAPAPAGALVLPWHYVADGGSDEGNDCTDRYEPCATIQHAIDESSPWDTVDVAAGTYAEQLAIDIPVTLRGAPTPSSPTTAPRR